MPVKKCSSCTIEFSCGMDKKAPVCWCHNLPQILPAQRKQDCLCPVCLAQEIGQRIERLITATRHEKILEMASQYRNEHGLVENVDYTLENGNTVFSRWYHLKRGFCCGNGCQNCPYPV